MKPTPSPGKSVLWRWGVSLAILALLLGGLSAVYLWDSVDRVSSQQLRDVLEDAFHVPVRIGTMVVHLRRGMAEVDDVALNNPEGYEEPVALTIQHADGFVRLPLIDQKEVEIYDLQVIKPEFTVEFAGGQFNWTALIHRLAEPNPTLLPGQKVSPDKIFYRIDRIRIIEPAVTFRSSLFPGGKTTLHLKNLEIHNIGSKAHTATTNQVLHQLILELLGAKSVDPEGDQLPPEFRQSFQESIRAEHARARPGGSG